MLGDRILAHDNFNLFPRYWEKVEVFRGEYCLTNIVNRRLDSCMVRKSLPRTGRRWTWPVNT